MRKGRVELYQQLGYLADLLLLARTDPPPLHPVRGLRALPRGRRTPSGNNKCWRILWRGLWLPPCHPLGPLEPCQGEQSTMLHITLLCILVPVNTVEFCCLHSDNHVLPLLHVTAGDLKHWPKSVDPHILRSWVFWVAFHTEEIEVRKGASFKDQVQQITERKVWVPQLFSWLLILTSMSSHTESLFP